MNKILSIWFKKGDARRAAGSNMAYEEPNYAW